MSVRRLAWIAALAAGFALVGSRVGAPLMAQDATPAIAGVLAAFAKHVVVGIVDYPALQQEGDFYNALVQAPDFPKIAGVVVVEFGNARYQDVVDRYLSGADVSTADLRKAWQDVIGFPVGTFDAPTYQRFFETVRSVNSKLPKEQQIRVLLGQPPVDWNTIQSNASLDSLNTQRDSFMYKLIFDQVTGKQKHVLVLGSLDRMLRGPSFVTSGAEGGGPIGPGPMAPEPETAATPAPAPSGRGPTETQSTFQFLNASFPDGTYVIMPYTGFTEAACISDFEGKSKAWAVPSLVPVAGTWLLNTLTSDTCHPNGGTLTIVGAQGGAAPIDGVANVTVTTADAVLYLGNYDALTLARPAADVYDATYLAELNRRAPLMGQKSVTAEALSASGPVKLSSVVVPK